MIPLIDLAIGIAILIFSIMGVVLTGEARLFFITLAACGFFYGGFALLFSAFTTSTIGVYILTGICCIGVIVYAAKNAKAIIAET